MFAQSPFATPGFSYDGDHEDKEEDEESDVEGSNNKNKTFIE